MVDAPLYGPPKVGGDILSLCTKCKMELAHVVVSMVAGRPAKVQCKTCRSEHKYRRNEGDTAKTPRARSAPARKTFVRAAEHWEQRMLEKKAAPILSYNVKESYKAGDVLQHPKFGMGLVEEVKPNGKMTVLFRDGDKVLIYGLGGSTPSAS